MSDDSDGETHPGLPQPLASETTRALSVSLSAALFSPLRRRLSHTSFISFRTRRTCPRLADADHTVAGDLSMDSSSEDENEGMHPQVGGKVRPLPLFAEAANK